MHLVHSYGITKECWYSRNKIPLAPHSLYISLLCWLAELKSSLPLCSLSLSLPLRSLTQGVDSRMMLFTLAVPISRTCFIMRRWGPYIQRKVCNSCSKILIIYCSYYRPLHNVTPKQSLCLVLIWNYSGHSTQMFTGQSVVTLHNPAHYTCTVKVSTGQTVCVDFCRF